MRKSLSNSVKSSGTCLFYNFSQQSENKGLGGRMEKRKLVICTLVTKLKPLQFLCYAGQWEEPKNSCAPGSELRYLKNIMCLEITTTLWSRHYDYAFYNKSLKRLRSMQSHQRLNIPFRDWYKRTIIQHIVSIVYSLLPLKFMTYTGHGWTQIFSEPKIPSHIVESNLSPANTVPVKAAMTATMFLSYLLINKENFAL